MEQNIGQHSADGDRIYTQTSQRKAAKIHKTVDKAGGVAQQKRYRKKRQ